MKRSKEYRQLMRHYKKLMMKDARHASKDPFDYGAGLQVFVDHLYFMRDYYKLNENVWGADEEGRPTRLQMLNVILAKYEDWMHCEDRYYVFLSKDEHQRIPELVRSGFHLQELPDAAGTMMGDTKLLTRYESREENHRRFVEDYDRCRRRFFGSLAEYIEFLWD